MAEDAPRPLPILSPADVDAALAFKYRGEDRSLLYSAVLSPLAAAFVEVTPRWIA